MVLLESRQPVLCIRVRNHRFFDLPDPDPALFVRIRIRILQTLIKIGKKTLISTVSCLLYDFLSLENDVSVHSKSNQQTNAELWIRMTH